MTADELGRFLFEEGQRWLAAHDFPTSRPWAEHSDGFRALHAAVAEAVLRELGCPAPLVVDAGGKPGKSEAP